MPDGLKELPPKAQKRAAGSFLGWCLAIWTIAVVAGWMPNPLARFFQAGPNVYRNFGNVLVASNSSRLQYAVKETLEKDGKLTQANLEKLWPIYEDALPDGFRFSDASFPVEGERQRLIQLVGAKVPD